MMKGEFCRKMDKSNSTVAMTMIYSGQAKEHEGLCDIMCGDSSMLCMEAGQR